MRETPDHFDYDEPEEPEFRSAHAELSTPEGPDAAWVRQLAGEGRLAAVVRLAEPEERRRLWSGAHTLAYPVLFQNKTRKLEWARGHYRCAGGFTRMEPECLDRFHDDMESVVARVLTGIKVPVKNLEGWIAAYIGPATMDGNRKRRTSRGAQAKPHVPPRLAADLPDPWSQKLAVEILTWVGVPETCSQVWPLESWALKRAAFTGDWSGSDMYLVGREVESVLVVMRRHTRFFARYVEEPLGLKRTDVAGALPEGIAHDLALIDDDERAELWRLELLGAALDLITARLDAGIEPTVVVADALREVFGRLDEADIEAEPCAATGDEEHLQALLQDPDALARIAEAVLRILRDRR